MELTLGTFNLNNLFSRFDFKAEVDMADADAPIESRTSFSFDDPQSFVLRTYKGRLVKPKDDSAQQMLAERIKDIDVDVLAVQEVEDVDTLGAFNRNQLQSLYPYIALVEGNDPRLIDLGVMSKLPLGAVTSWRHAVYLPDPGRAIFSRDMLEVEVMNAKRRDRLLTLFVHHLKSRFVPFPTDQESGSAANDELRRRQCVTAASIIAARTRPDSSYAVLGDMNDNPDSPALAPLVTSNLGLVNALSDPVESHPSPTEDPMPTTTAWTERFKPAGKPAQHNLFDQIWLSPSLSSQLIGSGIQRRARLGGEGSDHDPAWVRLGNM
jgi:endonuclease/exonuclease/phosphatase family metal-dependent hydrolase